MQSWIEGFQESIDYMEENLTNELDIEIIAGKLEDTIRADFGSRR